MVRVAVSVILQLRRIVWMATCLCAKRLDQGERRRAEEAGWTVEELSVSPEMGTPGCGVA